jgi:hypothetical protein
VSATVAKNIESVPSSAASEKGANFQFKEIKELAPEPTSVEPDKSAATTVELPPKTSKTEVTNEKVKVDEVKKTTEEPPMSEAAKRRAEMEKRRAEKQKELDAIKLGKSFNRFIDKHVNHYIHPNKPFM